MNKLNLASIFADVQIVATNSGIELEKVLLVLTHFLTTNSGALTALASTVEIDTGNASLVPLTNQVGASVSSVLALMENHASTCNIIADLANHVSTIAGTQGNTSVAQATSMISQSAINLGAISTSLVHSVSPKGV